MGANYSTQESQEPDGGQPSEFQNFASALKTIMAVRKDDLDLGPVRPRQKRRTSPKQTDND